MSNSQQTPVEFGEAPFLWLKPKDVYSHWMSAIGIESEIDFSPTFLVKLTKFAVERVGLKLLFESWN